MTKRLRAKTIKIADTSSFLLKQHMRDIALCDEVIPFASVPDGRRPDMKKEHVHLKQEKILERLRKKITQNRPDSRALEPQSNIGPNILKNDYLGNFETQRRMRRMSNNNTKKLKVKYLITVRLADNMNE